MCACVCVFQLRALTNAEEKEEVKEEGEKQDKWNGCRVSVCCFVVVTILSLSS